MKPTHATTKIVLVNAKNIRLSRKMLGFKSILSNELNPSEFEINVNLNKWLRSNGYWVLSKDEWFERMNFNSFVEQLLTRFYLPHGAEHQTTKVLFL
jgi:hypothetical protein